jgi:hypothetical protein
MRGEHGTTRRAHRILKREEFCNSSYCLKRGAHRLHSLHARSAWTSNSIKTAFFWQILEQKKREKECFWSPWIGIWETLRGQREGIIWWSRSNDWVLFGGRSKVGKHIESDIHCSSLFLSEEGKVEKMGIALESNCEDFLGTFSWISYSREDIGKWVRDKDFSLWTCWVNYL